MGEAADSDVLADPHAQFARWQMPVFESVSNDAPLTAQALDDIERRLTRKVVSAAMPTESKPAVTRCSGRRCGCAR